MVKDQWDKVLNTVPGGLHNLKDKIIKKQENKLKDDTKQETKKEGYSEHSRN